MDFKLSAKKNYNAKNTEKREFTTKGKKREKHAIGPACFSKTNKHGCLRKAARANIMFRICFTLQAPNALHWKKMFS